MSPSKKSSTHSLPKSNPIYVTKNSIEVKLLDPQYYRIVNSISNTSPLTAVIPSPVVVPDQFGSDSFIKTDKINIDPNSFSIAPQISLDDITIVSGPTSYMDGTNKRYEYVFKILNRTGLDVKDVEYRIAETG